MDARNFGLLVAVVMSLSVAPTTLASPARAEVSQLPAEWAPSTATITLTPRVGPPTTMVTVTGSGFGALESVEVDFARAEVGRVSTDATGAFTTSLKVPATARPGLNRVTSTGLTSGLQAATTFRVRTNWSMFHLDLANSGFNRYENVLSPTNVAELTTRWSFNTGSYIESSPAVVKGVVYVGSDNESLYALSARTGAVKWSFKTGYWVKSSPAVAKGVVYVGSNDGKLYALDAKTGLPKWAYNAGYGVEDGPTVVHGVVYFGSDDGVVHAVDATTGTQKWSYTIGNNGFYGSPAVVRGVVYVGSWNNGKLYAIDAATGTLKWSYATTYALTSPVVVGGTVYLALDLANTGRGGVEALDASTGTLKWFTAAGDYVFSTPAVAKGVVYVGCGDRKVYALKASTGALKWTASTGSDITASPAVANGIVYVGSHDGKMYAFDASTGDVAWTFDTGSYILSSPAVVDGVVYTGSNSGMLYAFGRP